MLLIKRLITSCLRTNGMFPRFFQAFFHALLMPFPMLLDTKKRGKLEGILRFSLVLGSNLFD